MSKPGVDITEEQILDALRAWLIQYLDCEIVQAQDNRVAQPVGPFVTMTALNKPRLSTNTETWDSDDNLVKDEASLKQGIQLDIYGPLSGDWAATISQMFRSQRACEFFEAYSATPLYNDDPHQAPLIDGEEQYEQRWTIDVYLQYNPTVSSPQDFADNVVVDIHEVDATYPPS
jgi:hypothetical protein